MSAISSTVHSSYPDSDNMRRDSADSTSTNGTSTSEFLAAVATEPPCEEAWAGYLPPVDSSPVSKPRTVQEPSDILPEPNQLAEASSIPVLDSDGNEITFQELYKGGNYLAERRLVLFLRHWYCRVSPTSTGRRTCLLLARAQSCEEGEICLTLTVLSC